MRTQRRILEGAMVASLLSGTPSVVHAWATRGSAREAVRYGLEATRAIGTAVPGRGPGLARGAVMHCLISVAVAEGLGALLPAARGRGAGIAWGAVAGGGVGAVNLGVVARRWFPALAALPRGPQLADNAAFGAVFAAVADRR